MTLPSLLLAAYDSDDRSIWQPASSSPSHAISPILVAADRQIVERLRQGDQHAFDALFREHFEPLSRFALKYCSEPVAAEVVSEMFLRLWVNRESWSPKTSVRAYLYGTVRWAAIDLYRSQRAETRRHGALLGHEEVVGMSEPIALPSASAEQTATMEIVWNAIATLSEIQQQVMALRWQAHLPWDDVASIVGLSVVAVRKQHSRALAKLRALLPAHLADD